MVQKKVLLAEDDLDDRMIFEDFLEDRNDFLLISVVENGVEIFEFLNGLNSESELPQLIILDKNMPKINGVEALKLLKSEEKFSKISVVLFAHFPENHYLRRKYSTNYSKYDPQGKRAKINLNIFFCVRLV